MIGLRQVLWLEGHFSVAVIFHECSNMKGMLEIQQFALWNMLFLFFSLSVLSYDMEEQI